MATDQPVTVKVEPRIRLWEATGEVAWQSSCDAPELAAELLLVLEARDDPHEWIYASTDIGPLNGASWRPVWAGRVRIGDDGLIETAPAGEDIEAIINTPNPIFGNA